MTIYVEDLREEIKRIPNPVVYADELTELLDAYEAHSECKAIQEHEVAVSRRWQEDYNTEFDKVRALTKERDRLRADVQAAIENWGCNCDVRESVCDCIIGDLKRALETRVAE